MTHINPLNESVQPFSASNSKGLKSHGPDAFANALGKALDKTQAPEMEYMPANALGEISSSDLNIINVSDIVSGKTDSLLEMLDSYSSKLGDETISLKSIVPVLEEINTSADSLLKETLRLTDADTDLKQIATKTIVTAQTEYLKFQRGDYLS